MGLRVNSEERVSPMQSTEFVQGKPKKEAPVDQLFSMSKQQNSFEEKKFAEKVKAFFTSIWSWLSANVFCWCIKQVSEEDVQKQEAQNRFNGLNTDQKKEWKEGLDNFKKYRKEAFDGALHPHLKKELEMYSTLKSLVKENADRKQFLEVINEAQIPEETKKELIEDSKNEKFLDKLILREKCTGVFINYYEALPFAMFMQKKPSKLQIEAVFRGLSSEGKQRILEIYRKVNENTDVTVEEFMNLIIVKPEIESVKKTVDQIWKSVKEDFEAVEV